MQQFLETTPAASIIFVITLVLSFAALNSPALMDRLILHPYSLLREQRYYTLITSGFIHADIGHLLFNMLSFFFFAFTLERIVGTTQFAIIYLASLALSDISTIVKHKDNPNYRSLGASGAIAAVIFSFIIYEPSTRISLFLIPIGVPAPIFAVLYVAYSYFSARRQYDNVNHEAHLFGAVSGVVLTLLIDPDAFAGFYTQVFG